MARHRDSLNAVALLMMRQKLMAPGTTSPNHAPPGPTPWRASPDEGNSLSSNLMTLNKSNAVHINQSNQ